MKKQRRFFPILVFVLAQVACFALLALWIYWYVSTHLIFIGTGDEISMKFVINTKNITALVSGIVLMGAIATGMALIFNRLNEQIKVTKMYDTFIANVTHELKTPLASMQLYLETLSSRTVSKKKQAEFLELMQKDTNRLKSLINAILDISLMEAKKNIYNLKPCRMEPLLLSLIDEAVSQFNLPEGSVETGGSAPCDCMIDRGSFRIVVNNLFDNAIKYSPEAVHLTVTLGCTERRFFFEVTDRGIGIQKQEQRSIFKRFIRLYSPIIPSIKGTGLGLHSVKEIIRHHRGRVTVNSEGMGLGTTFRIELPLYTGKRAGKT